PFSVKVIPVVDGPANSRKISLSEDTAAQGFHLPNLLDRDGSEEIVSVKLAALNTIEDLILVLDDQQLLGQNSELVFTAEEYKRLLIQAPNHSNQDFKLHVEYTVVDSQTMSASFDRQLIINVKGVADSAVFSVNDASVESGQSLTFNNQVGFVIGDSGDNLLIGSQKPNVLYAGKGDDKLYFDKEDLLQGSVDGGEGRDTGRFSSQAGESSTIDMAKHNLEVLFSGAGDEIVDASLVTEKVNLYTRSGSDFVTGSVFKDYIDSGEGDDVIDSGAGSDFVASGAGVDRYIVTGIENDYVDIWYDFNFNSDIIDLSRILPKQLTAQQLTNYISLTENELAVDVAGNANFITIAKFGSKKEQAEVVELTVDGQSLVEYSLLDQSYT
ncbi:MAG: hypothetical protein MI743_02905, partial [Sneathiellales bacterium]|nr:hypothetical protein [Sneathiellales bacterium]